MSRPRPGTSVGGALSFNDHGRHDVLRLVIISRKCRFVRMYSRDNRTETVRHHFSFVILHFYHLMMDICVYVTYAPTKRPSRCIKINFIPVRKLFLRLMAKGKTRARARASEREGDVRMRVRALVDDMFWQNVALDTDVNMAHARHSLELYSRTFCERGSKTCRAETILSIY